MNDDVAIDRLPAGPLDSLDNLSEQLGAIHAAPFGIAHAGGAQESVGDRVTNDVGIGVAD
jgi:hypothetical protein